MCHFEFTNVYGGTCILLKSMWHKWRMLLNNIRVKLLKRIGHFECSDLDEGRMLFNSITCI